MIVVQSRVKQVGDPNTEYETMAERWRKSRAAMSGEAAVKSFDAIPSFSNMLIPFSGNMTQEQFDFFKAEAEWPGISVQFGRMLVGGLLKKTPIVAVEGSVPKDAIDWIRNDFSRKGASLSAFLGEALWEELQTSRAWVFVNYPAVMPAETQAEADSIKPYPTLKKAEQIINWAVTTDDSGREVLSQVIVKGYAREYDSSEFHPDIIEKVWVHEIVNGLYQVRVYRSNSNELISADNGELLANTRAYLGNYSLEENIVNITNHGKRLTYIPAWPLNGEVCIKAPMLESITSKEVHLYNLLSRRNHLIYGAATYTPVISADINEEQFQAIVDSGLGTWVLLPATGKAEILKTPTEALQDMERAIAANVEHMSKLGVRMLAPDTPTSGVALEIMNAAPDSMLGVLGCSVSTTMQQVVKCMVEWRYGVESVDVQFSLSEDFDPVPLGADWLRLATEWYEKGLVPRSVWLHLLKKNEMLCAEYDDATGKDEITNDALVQAPR